MKELQRSVWDDRHGQSLEAEVLYDVGGKRIQCSFTRNSYDFQSHVVARIYSQEQQKWNFLVELREPLILRVSRYEPNALDKFKEALEGDLGMLLAQVQRIIGSGS